MRFLQFIDFKVDLRYKTAQFRHLLVLTTIPTVVNPQMSRRFDSYFFLRLQKNHVHSSTTFQSYLVI